MNSRCLYDQTKDSKYLDRADTAAQWAESLNQNLPEVHVALGAIDEALRRLGLAYLQADKGEQGIDALSEATKVNPY
jgi:hypothetical protein